MAARSHLHFFDMSQFGQPHAAASLFGQARGYVGSNSYGSMTAALRDMPELRSCCWTSSRRRIRKSTSAS